MKVVWANWSDGDKQLLIEGETTEEVEFLASFAGDIDVRWFPGEQQLIVMGLKK